MSTEPAALSMSMRRTAAVSVVVNEDRKLCRSNASRLVAWNVPQPSDATAMHRAGPDPRAPHAFGTGHHAPIQRSTASTRR